MEQHLKNKFEEIKSKGFVKSTYSKLSDGQIGNTFEELLGIAENNISGPDIGEYEVKTQRQLSKNPITLYTRKPTEPVGADKLILKKYGVNDPKNEYPEKKVLNTTVYANEWKNYYDKFSVKMNIDYENEKIELLYKFFEEEENIEGFWTFRDIKENEKKLKNLIAVSAETKTINNTEHYRFDSAKIYKNYKGFETFIELLDKKIIRYENRNTIYRTGSKQGQEHNHGGAFRISKNDLHLLYEQLIELN